MNAYQLEQMQALGIIRRHGDVLKNEETLRTLQAKGFDLEAQLSAYLAFREDVGRFFGQWFEDICTARCYTSDLSACCAKDAILIFWGDLVVNSLLSTPAELDRLKSAIRQPAWDARCIYLAPGGCSWRIKPIVCEMFLCADAEKKVFGVHPEAKAEWVDLEAQKKAFTWPDRPVLFEILEAIYIDAGCDSSLMHMHKSPGLQRLIRNR